MISKRILPTVLAVAGFTVIVIGIYQGLLHVAPGYDGTIMTGWDGGLNHEERLLAGLGAVGIAGAVATIRWKQFSIVPGFMGGVVLFYAVRAIYLQVQDVPLYTETTLYSGETTVFVLGSEPFLLIAGGLLLIGAGTVGWIYHPECETASGDSVTSSTPA